MLENTAGLRPSGRVEARAHAFGSNHDQLAGFHLALVSGANQVKSAGLGGEHNGVVFFGSLSRNSRGSRAAKIRSALIITSENAPSTRRSASAMASGRVCSFESAIRCTITSVSLLVWKIEPCASSF